LLDSINKPANITLAEFNDTLTVLYYTQRLLSSKQNAENHIQQMREEQIDSLKRKSYLQLQAGVYENFNQLFIDETDGFFFRRRIYAGFDADLFRGGLRENHLRAKKMKLSHQIQDLLPSNQVSFATLLFLNQEIENRADEQSLYWLQVAEALLNKRMEIVRTLIWLEKAEARSFGELQNEKNRVQNKLEALRLKALESAVNQPIAADIQWDLIRFPEISNLPLFPKWKSSSDISQSYLLLVNDFQDQNRKLARQIRLTPYIRYQTFDFLSSASRNFYSAGLTFGIPISLSFNKKNSTNSFNLLNEEFLGRDSIQRNECSKAIEAFTKQYSIRSTDQQALLVELKSLKHYASTQFLESNPYNSLAHLALWTNYAEHRAQMMTTNAKTLQLYLSLIAKHPEPERFRNIPFSSGKQAKLLYDRSVFPGNRSVYLWSHSLQRITTAEVLSFLQYQSIERLFLSIGSTASQDTLKHLIKSCQALGIEVHAVIGEAKWAVPPFDRSSINRKLEALKSWQIDGIHIDCEPQSLSDWKARKVEYLNEWATAITYISKEWRKIKPKSFVSIAIPSYYGDSVLLSVKEHTDEWVLMLYEIPPERIVGRLQKVLALNPEGCSAALRPEDFKNRASLEANWQEISAILSGKRLVLHDLERLLNGKSYQP